MREREQRMESKEKESRMDRGKEMRLGETDLEAKKGPEKIEEEEEARGEEPHW